MKRRKHPANRGKDYKRTEYVFPDGRPNPEKVFADAWEKENEINPGTNFGFGILQDLFMDRVSGHWWSHPYATHVLNGRERMIAATVVQWLGTNCGFGFLVDTLRKCGYRITRIPETDND